MPEEQKTNFHIDTPRDGILTKRLVRFAGWLSPSDVLHRNFTIKLNGEPQRQVRFYKRGDLDDAGYADALCWDVFCDLAMLGVDRGTVHLEVLVGALTVFRRNYRIELQPRRCMANLIFAMHVPKTAGTSLRQALIHEYGDGVIPYYPGSDHALDAKEVARFSPTALDDLDVLYGHFPFGIHDGITTREVSYIAFLRRPFDHALSIFFYKKHVLGLATHRDVDIVEALEARLDCELDNCFTRYFANRVDNAPVDEGDLGRAIANIERSFPFIGVLDYVDGSVERLNRLLGTNMVLPHLNQTPDHDERRHLDVARFRQAAKPHLLLDLQLYDYVLERFWGAGERTGARAAALA